MMHRSGGVTGAGGSTRQTERSTYSRWKRMMASATFKTEIVSISKLKPHPRNYNSHPADQLEHLAQSVRDHGFYRNVVVASDLTILAGHGAAEAAKMAGLKSIPVRRLDIKPDSPKALKILAGDNEIATLAKKDDEQLVAILDELRQADEDLLGTGWDNDQLDDMLRQMRPNEELEDPEPEFDRAEELREKWGTETGQLWIIQGKQNEHRLLCGDATKVEDVERVMGGEHAGLMNTDPPYGVAYANDDRPNPGVAKPRVAKPRVANDTLCDEDLQSFLETAFTAASNYALLKNAAWYMWHAHLTQGYFAAAAAAAAADVVLHRQIIWVKPVLLLGRGHYHWKHEPCFMGWVKGNQPPDYGEGNGERTQTTVWEIASVSHAERKEYNHSTPKPVKLFAIPIVKHLKKGETCYEPFAGSGPQFIAAEQLGRRCYGMEISPAYVAVALERMTKLGCTCELADHDQTQRRRKAGTAD